ncbi:MULTISPECIES: YjcZ family sporulation protein [Paenibacillus]|uniref:YjcZ family sporulation protein n=1 Tax=Paenibacillus lignilyticus TaxID=1172615 RepID=A0ABS5CMH8_9BACL|nr:MULTISPECIES: YjcZ family sporulation protein [Paenibacillus]MBP3967071.1 YjcZ family sporulation protein [Paenibacillus lignilyticus]SFS98585.1 conserved hypothetical tiny transmembrane protein [Paenibacillus sp. BC26]
MGNMGHGSHTSAALILVLFILLIIVSKGFF